MDIKKIVIAFSVLLMISGGTISILKWLEIGPFAPVVVDKTVDKPKTNEPPLSIPLDELVIPVFGEDTVAATVVIKLSLEVLGSKNEEKVNKILPRLSDAFVRDLHTFIPRVVHKQKKVSADLLRQRLLMTGRKIVGKDVLNNIVIESVSER